jgi:hypothetical protein
MQSDEPYHFDSGNSANEEFCRLNDILAVSIEQTNAREVADATFKFWVSIFHQFTVRFLQNTDYSSPKEKEPNSAAKP